MRQYGHGPVQIRILHQIPLYISATADLAHNRCGQIYRTERRAGTNSSAPVRRTGRRALAAARVGTPSLARIAETWWSDGLDGDEQLRGDLGVGLPGADQVEHLALAPGQPERVAPGWPARPAGIDRTPSARRRCRMTWAAASAPRPVTMPSASRRAASSGASSRASAASYGQPRSVQAARPRPGRRRAAAGTARPPRLARARRSPVRRSQTATAPRSQALGVVHTSSASSASRRAASSSPSSQCASARASRTGTRFCGSPASSAVATASSRYSQTPGSPRRARIAPSRISEQSRLTGDGPTSMQDLRAQRDGLVPAAGPLQHVGVLAAQADRERGDVVLVAVRDALGCRYRSASANSRLPA